MRFMTTSPFVDRLLHGRPHVLMDQIAQRDRALLMRQPQLLDTVVHGAFLRWSPAKATWLVVPNRKNAPFSFSPRLGPRPPPLAVCRSAEQMACQATTLPERAEALSASLRDVARLRRYPAPNVSKVNTARYARDEGPETIGS